MKTWVTLLNAPIRTHSMFEEALTDTVLNLRDRVVQLLSDSLALERVNGIRVGSGGHDNERDNGHLGAGLLQSVVKTYPGVSSGVEIDRSKNQ